ncbi:hypothetical protein [Cryptosporangium sp. NPDC048952]|uniref:hypothetical protein n=1 Tax=Cryptosporangium sp. NPDC048952 TaxID=3363961 RepID=UPI00371574E8
MSDRLQRSLMTQQPSTPEHDRDQIHLTARILISGLTGGLSFLLTNLTKQPIIWSLTLSVFLAGVTLVVQFLLDIERRIDRASRREKERMQILGEQFEEAIANANEATTLFQAIRNSAMKDAAPMFGVLLSRAAELDGSKDSMAGKLARTELDHLGTLLRELAQSRVSYDGEDSDWLLALTENAATSIDATSTPSADGGLVGFDAGFWDSWLGVRYLRELRQAIQREVKVRRIFILDDARLQEDQTFHRICKSQSDQLIQVRFLIPETVPGGNVSSVRDFILFDDELSYEVSVGHRIRTDMKSNITNTVLRTDAAQLHGLRREFEELWESARPYSA